jgi:hypothetical protein
MGEKVEKVRLIVHTEEEGAGVLERVSGNLKKIAQEQRASGEHQLESLIKGAGVAGLAMEALERTAKVAEASREAMKQVREGAIDTTQAWGQVVQKTSDAIPIFGSAVRALDEIGRASNDAVAALARAHDVDEDYIEQHIEDPDTVKERYEAINRAVDAASRERRHAREEADLAELKGRERVDREEEIRNERRLESIREERTKELAEVERGTRAWHQVMGIFRQVEEQEERVHQANMVKIRIEAAEQFDEYSRGHAAAMISIDTASRAARLQEAGLAEQAAALAVRERAEKEIEEREARMNRDIARDPAREGMYREDAHHEIMAITRRRNEELALLQREEGRRLEDEAAEHEERLARINAQAAAERLRFKHRDAEADLLALKSQHAAELAEIDYWEKQQKDRLERSGVTGIDAMSRAARIEREARERRSAATADYSARRDLTERGHAQAQADKDEQALIGRQEAQVQLLQAAGALGNKLAAQDAERLEILSRTESQIAAINRELREQKDLSPAARAELEKTAAILRASGAAELAAVGRGDAEPFRAAPGGEAGRGVRGYRAAAETAYESAEQRRYEATIKGLGLQQVLIDVMKQVADVGRQVAGAVAGGGPQTSSLRW